MEPSSSQDPQNSSTPPAETDTPEGSFRITINFSPERFSEPWTFSKPPLFEEVITECQLTWPQYDWTKAKAIPGGRKPPGFKSLLKSPDDDDLDLTPISNLSLKLMAPKTTELASLQSASAEAAALRARKAAQRDKARVGAARINARPGPSRPSPQDLQYNFQTLRPLPYLPNPQRSLEFLQRLRDDPGIRAAMKKHKFSVGLLTEMDPSQNTQSDHQGTTRILGLNRNRGEVIELRLRTDAYDGYRDYKTIRKTLCHELAHNVHSDHGREFLDLMHLIEREVARADYRSSGRSLGGEEYAPEREGSHEDEEEFMDHGGWTGGTYVLGAGGNGSSGQHAGLDRREILARAAEQRLRNLDIQEQGKGKRKEKEGSGAGNESGSGSRDGPAA
ncbi:WLM domain containing protein [Rhypophila decipiens]